MDANPDFTILTTDELEDSITRLTANINAATYQQLMMIAEFDRRNGWGHEGCRSYPQGTSVPIGSIGVVVSLIMQRAKSSALLMH